MIMPKKKKSYDDDDGRVIADMSGVTKQNLFGFQPRYMDEKEPDIPKPERNEGDYIQTDERFAFLGGAMKASLLIGAVYIAVFGVVIWLLTLIL